LEFARCVRDSVAAGLSAPTIHTSMTHGRGVITRSLAVSSLLRRPRAFGGQRTVARPTSADLVDGFRIAPAFGGRGAREARACLLERSLTRVLFDASDL
jgi:hypothetical protein